MNLRTMHWRQATALLLALQIALFLVIEPRGEFPLKDDWAYTQSVLWLLSEHRVRLSDWIGMNLLPQTLLGGATVDLFGFSFTALRHVTQAVALAGSVAMLWMYRAAGLTPAQALLAAVAVVTTPWWLDLANSYMTDVYAIALAMPLAALCLRQLASERPMSWPTLTAISLLGVLGVLQRQVVLVLPVAFGCAWTLRRLMNDKRSQQPWRDWVFAWAPLAACVLALALYKLYLATGPGVPAGQQQIEGRLLPMLGSLLAGDPFYWLWSSKLVCWLAGFIGLGVAAYGIILLGRGGGSAAQRFIVLIVALALIAGMLAGLWVPPYRSGQVIAATGIGPYTLFDVLGRFHRDVPTPAPEGFWRACAIVAAVGAGAFVAAVAGAVRQSWRERGADAPRVFLLVTVLLYLLPFAITDFIDRYLLFVLPFMLLLLRDAFGTPQRRVYRSVVAIGGVLMVVFGLLSTAASHDYFAWNRARWDAIAEAARRGATPENLDGGFEYNAFYRAGKAAQITSSDKSWWWVNDDRYCVTFDPRPGYSVLRSWEVRAWLPTTPRRILLLERIGNGGASAPQ
ncbi:MAG TPA: hypothetical protein VF420_17050 [Casimicrobiaceae bacterium]